MMFVTVLWFRCSHVSEAVGTSCYRGGNPALREVNESASVAQTGGGGEGRWKINMAKGEGGEPIS